MRTYYTWQLAASPDKSYLLAAHGLCSDAELSVGVLIGCFPIMPKFFQHVGPKLSHVLIFRSKALSNNDNNLHHRGTTFETHTLAEIKKPVARYEVGLSDVKSRNDLYAQLHGEYCTWNGSDPSQPQIVTEFLPTQPPDAKLVTRRSDLEYGHQYS